LWRNIKWKEESTLNRKDFEKLISVNIQSLDKDSFQYLFITKEITEL
jgi:hypothetical protein